ncbi:flavin-containing monooxygenase [Cytobacillus firmus]|uniref:flavin-containing monooxygenase n=1 Tax=Cytobacillus firmus TaxID=1399 RepID=UPI0018CE565C|nr:NAD(P)/FAD-dependent oxidoreductase [Cytobacillus firmus]MBG9546929.1 oxidoreductase [Cytobacillus firmus]MBG9603544.1 oxidoreductase [Cytobacillus firmus]MBG9656479.1 oxidoreductase [Cytobacillus firmus]MED1905428.1 NAD(P)/FAD-dependent oxidoreductase [Cytobacillus firmus]MED1941509.1 NAD(P)/FAD-dependent oxidoreductase [Cytobacillus firmus]
MKKYEAVIIGGGQAGLAMGYFLKKEKLSFVIIEKNGNVGDSWRQRYNSLVLFTPRQYSSLPGLQMRGPSEDFPTKDDIADYLNDYVKHFDLPVMLNTNVTQLNKLPDSSFIIETNRGIIKAQQVIIAAGAFQKPYIPPLSKDGTGAFQLHSSEYRSPEEVPGGEVLIVGGGNSGAQLAVELAKDRKVTIAVGHRMKILPLTILGKSIFYWLEKLGLLFAGTDTIKGSWFQKQKDPIFGKELKTLIQNKKVDVKPKVLHVSGTEVLFGDGTQRNFESIIWSTGFVPSYEWIRIEDVVSDEGKPIHKRGITGIKGLYFIGLPWQYQRGSALICGVGKDAEYLLSAVLSNRT